MEGRGDLRGAKVQMGRFEAEALAGAWVVAEAGEAEVDLMVVANASLIGSRAPIKRK